MYIKKSVNRPTGNPGNGIQPKDQIIIIDTEDILSFPQRDDAGIVIAEDIVMKPGAYGIGIYLTSGTVEVSSNSEGETDAMGFTPSVKFNHPGNEQDIREFKTHFLGKRVIAIINYCSGKPSDLIGSPCNPAQLSVSYTGGNDSNTNELTFAQISKGDDIAIYKGTVTMEEPVAVVEGTATKVQYKGEGQYQLSSGSGAISTIEGGAHGAVITLLGTSGTAPTVVGTGNILLKGGQTFSASAGCQITFRAFKDGADSIKWVEQSRFNA